MNPLDGIRQEWCDAEDLDARKMLFRGQGNAIRDHDLLDGRVAQAIDGFAAQNAVRSASIDFTGAVEAGDIRGADHAAGRRNHVVENNRHLALQGAADQVGLLGFRGAGATLIDNGNRAPQFLLMDQSALDASLIRTEDDEIPWRNIQAADVFVDDRGGMQVVHRDVEESLDLGGVQVQGQHAIGACDSE